MSDIDKFVMEYVVETKDSLAKLESLLSKMDSVEKKSQSSSSSFSEIKSHLNDLASEAGDAGKAIAGIGNSLSELAGAAGPIAAIISVIMLLKKVLQETKAVMDEINEQRDLGAKTGMSALAVENISRNVASASGSQVDRKGAEDLISKMSDKLRSAYSDPTQMNRDAILLRQSGVNINAPGGGIQDTQTALAQLSTSFKNMTQEQANAYGELYGFTQQQVQSMRSLGASIVDTTHMTAAEAATRQEAYLRTQELNAASNSLSEHWRQLRDDVFSNVIPAIDGIVKVLDKAVNLGSKARSEIGGTFSHVKDFAQKHFKNTDRDLGDLVHGRFKEFASDIAGEWKEPGKVISGSAKDILKSADTSNKAANQYAADMQRLIALFGQSVSQFSTSIDERQAWAAWAGEIGRANGLSTSGNRSLGLTGTAGNGASFDPNAAASTTTGVYPVGGSAKDIHTYDDLYKKAAAATGLSPDFIKRVAMAESSQNPSSVSKAGAVGLMQIMPSNFSALGITNALDPAQNIMGGAKLLAQLMKQFGNESDALRAYNAGPNKAHWNNKETMDYAGRVMAQNATIAGFPDSNNPMVSGPLRYALDPKSRPQFNFGGGASVDVSGKTGESKESMGLTQIQDLLAQQIGVDPRQLKTGDVSTGDLKYGASNLMASLSNSRLALKNQLNIPGLTSIQQNNLQQQLATTDLQLQGMMRYMPQIEAHSQPGDRNVTIGQGAVQVIVEGAHVSAEEIAREINNTLVDHIKEANNGMSDGISH